MGCGSISVEEEHMWMASHTVGVQEEDVLGVYLDGNPHRCISKETIRESLFVAQRTSRLGRWQGFSLSWVRCIKEWQGVSTSGSRFLTNPCQQFSQESSCTQLSSANPCQQFLRTARSSKSLRADRPSQFLTPRTNKFPRTTGKRSRLGSNRLHRTDSCLCLISNQEPKVITGLSMESGMTILSKS